MGAASSPDRREEGYKRRREDSRERGGGGRRHGERSRERSRERSKERGSHHHGREADGSSRQRQREDDRRDRPASTSGRDHYDGHHHHSSRDRGRGGSRHRDDRDGGQRQREDRQDGRDRHADRDSGRRGDAGRGSSREDRRGEEQQQQRPREPPPARTAMMRGGHRSRLPEGAGGEEAGRPRWGKPEEWAADEAAAAPPAAPKQGPNMGLSGKLAAETNKTADGQAELKYVAPPEARVCKKPVWRLYVFKGQETVAEPLALSQMPYYLFGKDRKVADVPTDHPSCSRQHAVVVFREVEVDARDGIGHVRVIKPYLLDLESINGTTINGERLEAARYYELLTGDVVRFGFSSREYVVMSEAAV